MSMPLKATSANPCAFLVSASKLKNGKRVVNLYMDGEVVGAPECEKTIKLNTHAASLTAEDAP